MEDLNNISDQYQNLSPSRWEMLISFANNLSGKGNSSWNSYDLTNQNQENSLSNTQNQIRINQENQMNSENEEEEEMSIYSDDLQDHMEAQNDVDGK